MATWTRIGAGILLLLTAAALWHGDVPASAGPITVEGATQAQRALVEWALGRYRRAGLELPPVDVHFHADPAGCGGNSGFYASGRLDMCVTEITPYARNVIVHELAHAWSDRNLSAEERDRFLHFRHLTAWDSWDDPWAYRGTEQAAEIITWGVGDRAIPPLLEDDDDPEQLLAAYEVLTGGAPPARLAEGPGPRGTQDPS